jgi:hypothetical protein
MPIKSESLRWEIVEAWKDLKNISAVAARCGNVSRACVRRWVNRYLATKHVDAKPSTGRRPALSQAAREQAYELMFGESRLTAKDTALKLKEMGMVDRVVIKKTVLAHVQRVAAARGNRIFYRRGKPRVGLTAATKAKRLAFAQANANTDWTKVLFSDRKKFVFKWPGSRVDLTGRWEVMGEESEGVFQPTHPQVLNGYAAISVHGVTTFHVVAGTSKFKHNHANKKGQPARNVTSGQYAAVLRDTFLPQGEKHFTAQSSWVLQQDGDPSHKVASRMIAQWNKEHRKQVHLLQNWPPNSPDLNPIENIWALVQREVYKIGCNSFDDFKAAVIFELQSIAPAVLSKYILSLPNRLAEVIKNKGGKTRY